TLFGARVAAPFDVAPAALTEMEQQTVVGSRWWSVGELRASSDTVIPPDLADVVERLVATDAVSRPVRRRAGRMLVIDPDGCVLLIRSRQAPDSSTVNWVAPGGGVEQGETTAQAAVRELFEETGIVATVAADAQPVSSERAVFLVGDWHLDQTDDYYVWRVDERAEPDRSRLTAVEQATVLDYAWWSACELSVGTERYWPADLPSVLSRLAG
ncbi:MAG: NUDIX domain-containing protein, partial [Janthinobacterium lividum]